MMTKKILRTRKLYVIGIIFSLFSYACSPKVVYDMRKLENPVVMNSNPFIGDRNFRPKLETVDAYSVEVYKMKFGGQYTTNSSGQNPAQVEAFKKIGGDDTKAITDVKIDLQSFFFYGLLLIGDGNNIAATGKIRQIGSNSTTGEAIE